MLCSSQGERLQWSLDQAKSRFLAENLDVLAAQFNVADAEAALVQAQLWNNPNFVWNSDMYSIERNEYFNFRNQVLIQMELMVPVAGRIRKAKAAAESNVEEERFAFQAYVRELVYEFTRTYHDLAVAQEQLKLLNQLRINFSQVLEAASMQQKTGAISLSELIRLESEKLTLEAEILDVEQRLLELQGVLKTMLYLKPAVQFEAVLPEAPGPELPALSELLAELPFRRSDYLAASQAVATCERKVSLEKALALGDVKLGFQPHDRGSNYVRPYQGLVVEIPLPAFNRNQGGITIAKNDLARAQLELLDLDNSMRQEVVASYLSYTKSRQVLSAYSTTTLAQVEALNQNATANYLTRNLTLLEYLDLQRIYRQTKSDFLAVQRTYLNARGTVLFVSGLLN